jgi:RNA polymerase sigma factor (sigma-70 family)
MPLIHASKAPFSEQEFSEIHASYSRKLFSWFRKRVGHSDVAEELSADTLIKLWQSEFRGGCSLKTWIYQIARSVLSDWRRSTKKRRKFLENAMENRVALERKYDRRDDSDPMSWEESIEARDHSPNPEIQALIHQQLAGKFSDPRLQDLDPTTKQILIRYFVHNDPVEEIATELGMSTSAVYKKILRICPKS